MNYLEQEILKNYSQIKEYLKNDSVKKREILTKLDYYGVAIKHFRSKYLKSPVKDYWFINMVVEELEEEELKLSKRLRYLRNKNKKDPRTGELIYKQYDIEAIKESVEPETIIGYKPVKRMGNKDWYRCPLHNEKTPSFVWNREEKYFKCFGCGESSDIIGLYMKLNKCDFKTALKRLS